MKAFHRTSFLPAVYSEIIISEQTLTMTCMRKDRVVEMSRGNGMPVSKPLAFTGYHHGAGCLSPAMATMRWQSQGQVKVNPALEGTTHGTEFLLQPTVAGPWQSYRRQRGWLPQGKVERLTGGTGNAATQCSLVPHTHSPVLSPCDALKAWVGAM